MRKGGGGRSSVTLARGLENTFHNPTSTTMNAPIDIYRALKSKARRLLLAGDLDRYLLTLRRMHELRRSGGTAMA